MCDFSWLDTIEFATFVTTHSGFNSLKRSLDADKALHTLAEELQSEDEWHDGFVSHFLEIIHHPDSTRFPDESLTGYLFVLGKIDLSLAYSFALSIQRI